MDFTRAPLVAAFFALEADLDAEYAAVWAIEALPCRRRAAKRLAAINKEFSWLREHHDFIEVINQLLDTSNVGRFVAPVQPRRINQRMVLQHGTFMCLGDPGSDLFANLSPDVADEPPLRIVKVEFPRSERGDALAALRLTNISRDALFPGLDGLAQSLAHSLLPRNLERTLLIMALNRPSGWPAAESDSNK